MVAIPLDEQLMAKLCQMAHSEHLNITPVCTFARRDFSIFRPSDCDHLELYP